MSHNSGQQLLRAAVVQMTSHADLEQNLEVAKQRVKEAAAQGARLVVLPENFATLGVSRIAAIAEQEVTPAGPLRQYLSALARECSVYLVGGSIPVKAEMDELNYASCFVYDPQGNEIARYNKVHLFDASVEDRQSRYRESDHYLPGQDVVVFDTAFGRVGIAICYDLRFPELFLRLSQQGANIVVVPAAFTYVTGAKHWQVLLQARAIEQQVYLLAANQCGWHDDKRRTWGHSLIVSPDGKILADAQETEGLAIACIDLEVVDQVRRSMPVHEHRRLQ